jgi:uncharacterized protein (TIGR02284 family)
MASNTSDKPYVPEELLEPLQKLYRACSTNEEWLHAASEQMQNRGLKFMFKRFAQHHRRHARQVAGLTRETTGLTLTEPSRFSNTLRRGWMDIRIAMIVGRANRQHAAARRCDAGERRLLAVYDEVLALALPDRLQAVLQEQREAVARIRTRVQRAIAPDEWVIRLYDTPGEAEAALEELRESGITVNEVEAVALSEVARYEEDREERARSTADATIVGALIGAALGLGLGLIAGFGVPWARPAPPAGVGAVLTSTLVWGVVGMFIGGGFGAFFGFLLGHGLSEDDAALVASTPRQEAVLVSVQTPTENRAGAAHILGIRHQREIGPAAT